MTTVDEGYRPELADQALPNDQAAEQAVLGAMMTSPRAISEAAALVGGADFYAPKHEVIFHAIVDLNARGEAADAITVAAELTRRGDMGRVGGAVYLHEVLAAVSIASNVGYYAQIVREKAVLRRIVHAAIKARQMALEGHGAVEDIADEAVREMMAAAGEAPASLDDAAAVLDATFTWLDGFSQGRMVGVPTGLPGLDDLLGGLVPGRMVVLGARPSVGKTALALAIARHALGLDVPVLVFSAEMSSAELGFRLLVSETGISAQRYQGQAVADEEWEGVVGPAALRLRPMPLLVDDSGGLTMTDVSVRARRWRQDHRGGGGLIVIDYLQLLEQRGPRARYENRQTEVSAISRAVKVLAKDLDVPVLALSQLNRSPDARADRKPMLSDLRESGSLEQDADQVILEYEPIEPEREGELDLIVVKNRHGATGTVTVAYNRVLGRFTEMPGA